MNRQVKKWAKELERHFFQRRYADGYKHMKRCSTSLTIWEIQIKTTMRFHLTPIRMAIIKKSTNNKCCRGCGEKGTLLHCWWKCKLVSHYGELCGYPLEKNENRTAIWPSNPTSGHTHQGNHNWKRLMYTNVHCSTVCNSWDMETT